MTANDPTPATRTVLWAVLLASQAVYAGLLLAGIRVAEEPVEIPLLTPALTFVAIATAGVAHVLWRRASGADRALHAPGPDDVRSFTLQLIAWVLDESIAVYGLLLGFLALPVATWAPFSAAALALTLIHRPRPPAA